MAYEYESVTSGIFKFTIPGENRTVELFLGSKVIVEQKLTGSYLRLLRLVREIPKAVPVVEEKVVAKPAPKKAPAKKAPVKKTTTQKAKVADKITAVTEIEEVPTTTEKVEVETKDVVLEVKETEEKPAPKRRGRKKKTS